MSESVSSLLAGNMPMEAGQLPAGQLTDAADGSEVSDFASLFDDIDVALPNTEEASSTPPLELSELLDSRLTATLSDIDEQTQAQGNPLNSAVLSLGGNSLPSAAPLSPLVAISGYSAQANQDGAAAIAFQGDGKNILTSGVQYASTLAPALQQSQMQLHNMMQPNAMMLADMDLLMMPKADLGRQAELLAALSQQNITSSTDTPLSLVAQQPGQALMGLQGTTEFSNVLAASTRSPEPMTATLNQPQWNQQVGDRIHWMISQGLRQAEIRLNPPELGMLEVRVQMHGDQASIQFNTAHAEVKEALDTALPRLREMLAENGLGLADVNVSQQGQQRAKQEEGSSSNASGSESISESAANTGAHEIKSISGNGIIDFYA